MTLTEAIKHAEEVADRCTVNQFCAEEHRQLAEWLTILKDVYDVLDEYDIAYHRTREDLTSLEIDLLRALRK